jgi:two-component system NtrC family sensor kinase
MTLSRRMVLKNLGLLLGLLLFGAAAAWGMLRMRGNLRIATDEYSELRTIEKVCIRCGTAKFLLLDPGPVDRASVKRELSVALRELDDFRKQQSTEENEPEEHDLRELAAANTAMAGLEGITQSIDKDAPLDVPQLVATIDQQVHGLNTLGGEMDQLIKDTQHAARHNLQMTIIMIAALTVGILGIAVAVSLSQYRGVMGPLRSLREGARRIAGAKFSQRLELAGDEEFVSLAEDFNSMASELDDFYRKLEEKVQAKSKELVRSERLASVGYLAAGIAHEINNPLGIISGHAELAMRRLDRTNDPASIAKTQQALQIIWDEAFRCKEITEKLLSLARPGKGVREELSLARAARDTAMLVAALSHYRDRRLSVKLEGGEPLMVDANATEMRQVLLNLVINALDATEPVIGEVVIEGVRNNDLIELWVRDNGRGMTQETLERVFEPFFTDKRGSGAPGTGLGLSITHAIVESHGGTIEAHSDGPGKGSRLVVRLPGVGSAATADTPTSNDNQEALS